VTQLKVDLKIRVLPARHGLAWLAQGLVLVRAQPARLLFLAVLIQLILGLAQIPVLGLFIVLAMPAFSAGLLHGFQLVSLGQVPAPKILFIPLTTNPRTGRLLALGAVMFVAGIVCMTLMLSGTENFLDAELLSQIEQGDLEALTSIDPAIISRMILAVLVGVSVSGTLGYLAIPLIWFRNQKMTPAVISGLKALFMNWKPFTLLALGLMALLIPVALIVGLLYQLSGSAGALSFILLGLIMLITLAFQLAIFATQFCSFRDIFKQEEETDSPLEHDDDGPDQNSSEGDDGQLLA
jgi:hypothetical protein